MVERSQIQTVFSFCIAKTGSVGDARDGPERAGPFFTASSTKRAVLRACRVRLRVFLP